MPTAQSIKLAVDAVIFTVQRGALHVLLIQMKKKPFTGQWAFPGGLIETRETTEQAARRILATQTGVHDAYLEQLATFDDVARDPLGRVVSVTYYALLPSQGIHLTTTERYQDVRWWPVKKLPTLAYDHSRIARVAYQRLQGKIGYTNIAWSLLPKEFTLTELQTIYETILDRSFDKRNFRKKILSLNLIVPTEHQRQGEAHRPAKLFRFRKREPMIIDML